MKSMLLFAYFLLSTSAFAQVKVFETRKEADAAIKGNVYKTSIGWEIKAGDEVKLGKGSMPDKTFAFVTEMPNVLTYNQYANYNNHKLQHTYNGRDAKIADLFVSGNKKSGFYIVAKLKVGQLSRYAMDLENAIEGGEVVVPTEYAKVDKKETSGATPVSIADELKKLKEHFDSGVITKEEYEAAKKKLIEQ